MTSTNMKPDLNLLTSPSRVHPYVSFAPRWAIQNTTDQPHRYPAVDVLPAFPKARQSGSYQARDAPSAGPKSTRPVFPFSHRQCCLLAAPFGEVTGCLLERVDACIMKHGVSGLGAYYIRHHMTGHWGSHGVLKKARKFWVGICGMPHVAAGPCSCMITCSACTMKEMSNKVFVRASVRGAGWCDYLQQWATSMCAEAS
jgi:hypothetical protein